jgi:hypothetical protein
MDAFSRLAVKTNLNKNQFSKTPTKVTPTKLNNNQNGLHSKKPGSSGQNNYRIILRNKNEFTLKGKQMEDSNKLPNLK